MSHTVCDLLTLRAESDPEALAYVDGDHEWSWSMAHSVVREAAAGLIAAGAEPSKTVGLLLTNRVEHILGDLAALHIGACTTSAYTTASDDQLRHISDDSDIGTLILDSIGLERFRATLTSMKSLRVIVLTDDVTEAPEIECLVITWSRLLELGRSSAEEVAVQVDPDAPAVLIYTSGTTGPSKGVPLTHRQLVAAVKSASQHFSLPANPRFLSYLPLAHIAERVCSLYLPLHLGGTTAFCGDMNDLLPALQRTKPTMFFGVPRVWEKIRSSLTAKLSEVGEEQKRAVDTAMTNARAVALARLNNESIDLDMESRAREADQGLFAMIRSGLGLDQCAHAVTGGAPVSPDVEEFFLSLGIPLHQVYGLSETCGATVSHRPGRIRIGTVGEPLPGVEIRIDDDGEILIRSPFNTSGYRGLSNENLFTDDGYLRTGDVGKLDDNGFLSVTDRKKELIITAGGKNIGPNSIEARLATSPLIAQALVYGDNQRYLVALLTLDSEATRRWLTSRGVPTSNDLSHDPLVTTEVERVVEEANQAVSRVEHIKKWVVLGSEWTVDRGELTPTMKLKRRTIHSNYRDEIETMYDRN
ncbi:MULTISPECIES: long-chain fatty acid--CoA ligase [unclassified Rhodococcus (in: high G+C Gram-positive bacteria)]|uniref:AMP-dependent synthetase/ligase n=1 Tax=unclassified Rhodococcus (in: high G+C Gram-positive bacteria) TaxID=192944 RepID=UPI0015C6765C|nr:MULTISPECIES: AMP-dependent synthetase/ligase [unclassified Rhodococcus (in: high G+C Gram-positive bacteria)]